MGGVGAPAHTKFSICLLEDGANRLLFLRRAADAKIGGGQWGFPAGHIEQHESPLACARRELGEEIGSDHRIELRQSYPPVRDTFYGGRYEIHLFHFRWHSGDIVLNDEHTAFRWVARQEFKDLDVVLGVDEDILLLGIWPRSSLDPARLPDATSR